TDAVQSELWIEPDVRVGETIVPVLINNLALNAVAEPDDFAGRMAPDVCNGFVEKALHPKAVHNDQISGGELANIAGRELVIMQAHVSREKIVHTGQVTGDIDREAVRREKARDDVERRLGGVNATPEERDHNPPCKAEPHHR